MTLGAQQGRAGGLVIDARAELIARARPGQAALDPEENPTLRHAISAALALAYLHDLRPFARWVVVALEHGRRAGKAPALPASRPESRWVTPTASPVASIDLAEAAAAAHRAGGEHGPQSDGFRHAAASFVSAWSQVSRRVELVRPPPAHREPDFFKEALAYNLASWFPGQRLGATTLVLLFAALGTDPPIEREYPEELVADAIARGVERYRKLWARTSKRARTAKARFLVLPGRPAPLRSGKPSLLQPPFFALPTGQTVAHRPRGIPAKASVLVVSRGKRRWFYAQWRDGTRVRKIPLGPVADAAEEPRPAEWPQIPRFLT